MPRTWGEHFQKHRSGYIAVSSLLAAGVAGAALAFGAGDSTAAGFSTGVQEWDGRPRHSNISLGDGVYVGFGPRDGRSTGFGASSSRRRYGERSRVKREAW